MISLLIADDHSVVREGLKQIVADSPDIEVAGEACDGPQVIDKIKKHDFDVLLLDITLPGMSGLDVLKQVKYEKPGLQVLMLSIHPEEQYAVRALRDGASGYLTKESAPENLLSAIRKVAKGGKYVSESLGEILALGLLDDTEKPPHERLSDREFQVMCLIAKGKSLTDIAEQLSLSSKTISTYRARILEKMNMKRTAEIISYAIKKELVE